VIAATNPLHGPSSDAAFAATLLASIDGPMVLPSLVRRSGCYQPFGRQRRRQGPGLRRLARPPGGRQRPRSDSKSSRAITTRAPRPMRPPEQAHLDAVGQRLVNSAALDRRGSGASRALPASQLQAVADSILRAAHSVCFQGRRPARAPRRGPARSAVSGPRRRAATVTAVAGSAWLFNSSDRQQSRSRRREVPSLGS
jgi:hypothetical protein